MIKVNQFTNIKQVERFYKRIDIAGISISKKSHIESPYIDLCSAVQIRKRFPKLVLSVSFCGSDLFETMEIKEILRDIGAQYFEFTSVDFEKRELFEQQMNKVSGIDRKKIANGFFLQKDDCSIIASSQPFKVLRESGVEFFQFEIDSLVDSRFRIALDHVTAADRFFQQFDCLISDKLSDLRGYPIKSVVGFFFNIQGLKDEYNYDFSQTRWRESEILRILIRR